MGGGFQKNVGPSPNFLKDYFCYTDINNNHLQGVINILQLKITLQQKIISRKFPEAEKYNTSNDTDVQGLEDKILLFDFVSDTLKEYPDNLNENKLEEVKELNKKNQILKKNIQLLNLIGHQYQKTYLSPAPQRQLRNTLSSYKQTQICDQTLMLNLDQDRQRVS